MRDRHDTVIIGGGQAGLAMSYLLRQRGREHIILERRRVAERWRTERWDSLRYQLPNFLLALPGKSYAGNDPNGFVHHAEVIRFIEDYATEIAAPLRTGVEVTRLGQGPGGYELATSAGPITARHVVIATGPFQRPMIPDWSASIPSHVYQTETNHYRNPGELPSGAVLVVGSGNSGCQIADELQQSGRRVFLSVSRHGRVPRRYRGHDVIWWFDQLGRLDITIDTFPGRIYPPTTITTGMGGGYDLHPRRLGHAGVALVGRVLGGNGSTLALANETARLLAAADASFEGFIAAADALAAAPPKDCLFEAKTEMPPLPAARINDVANLDLHKEGINSIIWANGYGYDFDWLDLPITDDNGVPVQQRGVTSCRGIYFLGLHWMHTFRSGLFPFVGRDAAYLADHMDQLPQ